ncbi:MAG: ATP-binding protein, partial [Acidimicrobiales bacterium]|nr:ATP-binding protein [Acidimicrobiales bacterium]
MSCTTRWDSTHCCIHLCYISRNQDVHPAPQRDLLETNGFYEIIVERHQKASTILTSNRDPSEFLAQLADPLLAQSAVDR